MSYPPVLKRLLDEKGVKYEFSRYPAGQTAFEAAIEYGIPASRVARATLLRDPDGMLMVIYPVSRKLLLDALNIQLKRRYTILNAKGVYVPLAAIYHVDALVDETLLGHEPVYMVFDEQTFCRVPGGDFQTLQGTAIWNSSVFITKEKATPTDSLIMKRVQPIVDVLEVANRREYIKNKVLNLTSLPAIPKIAQQVLQLAGNPYANATDLAAIIEQDPALCAQLLRYARSPFYGYRGEVESVAEAISRVLGFDMVMDMALGISMGKAFRNPHDGPLGLNAYWRHATYSAALVQKLGNKVSGLHRPRPGMAYLAGLLQNIGLLLLGHLFRKEYKLLAKAVKDNPEANLVELEQQILGLNHTELGVWLLEAWNLPSELIIAVKEHHNPDYRDTHSVYPNLVMISNRLLSTLSMGDEKTDALPESILRELKLSEEGIQEIFSMIMNNKDGLDYMAMQMAA